MSRLFCYVFHSLSAQACLLMVLCLGVTGSAALADEAGTTSGPVTTRIEWDPSTLVLIDQGGHYGRIIRLDSGDLLAGYSVGRYAWASRSTDNGRTWQTPVRVAEFRGGLATNSELLQLADGRILYMWNQRQPMPPGTDFDELNNGIAIAFSDDSGQTWSGHRRIYGKGPMWEPVAIQRPDGLIQLFFANEKPYSRSTEQEISMLTSADGGKTWSGPVTVSFRKGHRDGMSVPVILQNGKTVVAIEDNGLSGAFKPVILDITDPKVMPIGGDSPYRWSALAEPLEARIYAGAPYLRQMPTGETILTSQVKTDGIERMTVWVGDAEARNFTNASHPFSMGDRVHQQWNSLFVKDEQTITAVTGTRINGTFGLWAIDGRLVQAN